MILKSPRFPAILALLLGLLTAFSPRTVMPQALANAGYQQLLAGNLSGPDGAVPLFEQAVEADSAFPWRWSDLAVSLSTGDRQRAEYCYARSLSLGPNAPQLAFRAANFYFRQGDQAKALSLTARILRQTEDFDAMVFSSWMRFGGAQDAVREVGVADNRRAAEAYFRFLLSRPVSAPVANIRQEMWQWMEQQGFATTELARSYAALLMNRNGEEAARIWASHVALPGISTGTTGYRTSNFVDDPGFENRDAYSAGNAAGNAAGFDWRISDCPGVIISRDSNTRR